MSAVRMLIFDLDDTLAPSKSPVPARMAGLLTDLLADREVCIISGGRFEQFEMQVLDHLDASTLRHRLHIMPTCGTQYFRWDGRQWAQQYAQNLSDDEKQRATAALELGARKLGLWEEHTWGPRIEDRGSQLTFSALGQSAPVAAKSAWDPSGAKKEALRRYAADRLPDLEVRSGGSTSVDITRKGIDKAYGVRQLCSILGLELADLHFVGDRLDPGGNDYPVRALGVSCTAVRNWQDTADYVARLLQAASSAA